MGWRFRKTLSLGRALFTLTKRGIGTSLRLPGFRLSRNPQGRWSLSIRIPHTGLTWIKRFRGAVKARPRR